MTEKVVIGNATLYHGDCREVLPTLPKVDAVITDPPYGIPHRFGDQNKIDGCRRLSFEWDGDGVNDGVFKAVELAAPLADGQFWFCGMTQISTIALTLRNSGMIDKQAAWVKTCPPPAMPGNWWPSGYEMAVFAYRSGAYFDDTNTKRVNVFYSDSYRHGQPGKEEHPTQKPLGLMSRILRAMSPPGGRVLDPFMGSGTTGVSAMQLGRQFTGIELERKYFDIACRRIEEAQKQGQMFPEEPRKQVQAVLV